MSNELRARAAVVLFSAIERALDDSEANTEAFNAWLSARSEVEGGFLWLVGCLGIRPSVVERSLRALIVATPRRRRRLRASIQRLIAVVHAKE